MERDPEQAPGEVEVGELDEAVVVVAVWDMKNAVETVDGIDVYHEATRPEIRPVVEGLIAGELPLIEEDQVCGGGR